MPRARKKRTDAFAPANPGNPPGENRAWLHIFKRIQSSRVEEEVTHDGRPQRAHALTGARDRRFSQTPPLVSVEVANALGLSRRSLVPRRLHRRLEKIPSYAAAR